MPVRVQKYLASSIYKHWFFNSFSEKAICGKTTTLFWKHDKEGLDLRQECKACKKILKS